MITLKKLNWDNCFSYGAGNELILNDNTVTQIIGTNGMGKSSIPLIIEEVLYNKNSKGIKKADIPNRYVNNGYSIKLEFSKGSDEYCISVDRKNSIKVKLEENGEDISSHTATNTYKTLQQIIGVDFKTFSQLVYQNTNASLQFLTATDSNRKKFLIDLLHLEDYVELFEIFKDASKETNTLITSSKSKIATIEKWLKDNKLEDTNILPTLKVEINTEEDEKGLSSLLLEIKNISENNKKIAKNNGLIDILKKLDMQKAELDNPGDIISNETERESLFAAKARKDNAIKTLKKIVGLGNTCHVCNQEIDEEFKHNTAEVEIKIRDEAKVEIERLEQEVNDIGRHNMKVKKFEKLQQDWSNTFRSIDRSLPTRIQSEEELKSKAEHLSEVLKEKRKEIKIIADQNTEITKRNTRIQVIQEQTQEFIT